MKFLYFLLILMPWAGLAAEQSAGVEEGIPYQKEALANSLRCLETIRGDDERIARTRCFIAENLAYLGLGQQSLSVLATSQANYRIPSGCVDTAMVSLGLGDSNSVKKLLTLGLDVLPFAVGRGADVVQFQILRVGAVSGDDGIVQRALDSEKLTQINLSQPYQNFLQDYKPNLLNKFLDRFFPDRHWVMLKDNATREKQISWAAGRSSDYFSALLFLRQAEAQCRAGKSYPSTWTLFAHAGIRAAAINTRPANLSAELASLALLQKKPLVAVEHVKKTWELLGEWAPQMSGIYKIERDLVLVLAALPEAEGMREEARERMGKRYQIMRTSLQSFELMQLLPLFAEAFHVLRAEKKAHEVWKATADLCALNQNPESQSIGLARIWMSYTRANTLPTKETETILKKIEQQLPTAYSKVKF
jgi:hypothetical protein